MYKLFWDFAKQPCVYCTTSPSWVSWGEWSSEQALGSPRTTPPSPLRGSFGACGGGSGWRRTSAGAGAQLQAGSPIRGTIHQRDGYCWEEFLPGGMNLQWLFSGAEGIPLPHGQGHRSARGWTLPHPLTPSSTPTHASRREPDLRRAQRPRSLPPLHFQPHIGSQVPRWGRGRGMAAFNPKASSLPLLTYNTPSRSLTCWTLMGMLLHTGGCRRPLTVLSFNLLVAWFLLTLPGSLPCRPHHHCLPTPGSTNRRKSVEPLWWRLWCWVGMSSLFCRSKWWPLHDGPGSHCQGGGLCQHPRDKGCEGCQFPFPNHLVWLCCAGGSIKEIEAQGQQLNLCAFSFFFFFPPRSFQCACLLGPQGITCSGYLLHCL